MRLERSFATPNDADDIAWIIHDRFATSERHLIAYADVEESKLREYMTEGFREDISLSLQGGSRSGMGRFASFLDN